MFVYMIRILLSSCEQTTGRGPGRRPEKDVLSLILRPYLLDVLYHYVSMISAWRGLALIIHNSGDNHAPRGISTSIWDPCGVPWGPPAPSRGCAHPRGGSKIIPPG